MKRNLSLTLCLVLLLCMALPIAASAQEPEQRVSFADFLQDNWIGMVAVIAAVSAIIIFLLYQRLKGAKKLNEQQRQIEDSLRCELEQEKQLESVTRIAYTDPLTGVKSKYAFKEAEKRMDQRIAEGKVS